MKLNTQWNSFLSDIVKSNNFIQLNNFIDREYKNRVVYPQYDDIFRAFNLLDPSEVKVVIIGQDPYHGVNQANGLAFSISKNCKIPPSLKNIFKELCDDIGCLYPDNGDLTQWAKEGVLLINSVLTVENSKPNSHKNHGWELFTSNVIENLSHRYKHIAFILWGIPSQKKETLIDATKHLILKAPHPSPLSSYRGFFGSKPFSKVNQYLKEHSKKEINWCLPQQ